MKSRINHVVRHVLVVVLGVIMIQNISAQTTEFSYQGSLKDGAAAANGTYDFEFALFDGGGAQLGMALTRNGVSVANGIFSVQLDFGNQFPGTSRFLEIRVRPAGGGTLTTLTPRQPISSAPYSVKSLNADTAANASSATNAANATNATNATTANNSLSLGGVAANQYLQVNGSGTGLTGLNAAGVTTGTLSNARLGQLPTANIADAAVTSAKIAGGQVVKSVNTLKDDVNLAAGANITITPAGNTLTIASTGNQNAILNQTTQQVASFNISGNGIASTLSGGSVNATNYFDLGSIHVLSANSSTVLVGWGAGQNNTGDDNSFVGRNAGAANTFGSDNTAVGFHAGLKTTSSLSSSFFGSEAGVNNTSGSLNSFFGDSAGISNTTEVANSFFGWRSDGAAGVINGTALGAQAKVTQSNSLVLGSINGVNSADADTSVGIGTTAPKSRFHIADNSGNILFGNAGCNSGFAAVGFGSTLNCTNYSLLGEGTNTVINRPTGGAINFRENNSTQMTINGGGNVGIGTLAPDSKLTVNGTASKPGGGSWATFSDERLKTIGGRFTPGLKAVMQLQPLRYEYKADNALGIKSDGEHIGFSAQSVEQIIPEAVMKNEKGYRLVNNDPILWAMLNAIKEQQAQIASQQKQITQFRSLICPRHRKSKVCRLNN